MLVLAEVAALLEQFKGLSHFTDLQEMRSKIQDKIHAQKTQTRPVIEFESNDRLKGLEFIEPLRRAISSRQAMTIGYQSFKAKTSQTLVFSACLLKEYRNRWFLLGLAHKKNPQLMTLALDRIASTGPCDEEYLENDSIDLSSYYRDVIGVTKSPGQNDCLVVFWIDQANAPYIETKPLHHTQQMLKQDAGGKIFSIRVILNFELERELLGFGPKIKVLSPRILAKKMKLLLQEAFLRYDLPTANLQSGAD